MSTRRSRRHRTPRRFTWTLTLPEHVVIVLHRTDALPPRGARRRRDRTLELTFRSRPRPPVVAPSPSSWITLEGISIPELAEIGRDQPYWIFASWVWRSSGQDGVTFS